MPQFFIMMIGLLYSCLVLAKPNYQVDVIVFAHPQQEGTNKILSVRAPIVAVTNQAITLKTGKKNLPYYLLPSAQSGLNNEYYLLSRKSPMKVLGHYSWQQKANSQDTVALPAIEHQGWQVQGTINIHKGTYYALNAQLQCSAPSDPLSFFSLKQNQRLQEGVVYYLDHPQIGMIVKVHQV